MSDVMKHGVMALTESGGSNLLDFLELLEDPERRRLFLPRIRDPLLRRYWESFDELTQARQETRTRSSLWSYPVFVDGCALGAGRPGWCHRSYSTGLR
jgi:hypothetical protein